MSSIILILDNIRSTHNVGSILRTADGFGVASIAMCGYTPYPKIAGDQRLPHEYEKITRAIHKTALGAESYVPIEVFATTEAAVIAARSKGYVIACLEQSPDSTLLPHYNAPEKLAIILGNELTGVSGDTLSTSDLKLEIPMVGKKESFNVSVSAAICLYALTTGNIRART